MTSSAHSLRRRHCPLPFASGLLVCYSSAILSDKNDVISLPYVQTPVTQTQAASSSTRYATTSFLERNIICLFVEQTDQLPL